MRHSMKPDLRADYKIRLYTGPKTPFFEVSTFHTGAIVYSEALAVARRDALDILLQLAADAPSENA